MSPIGLARDKFYDPDWKKKYSTAAGRMYGRVKWRGCIVEIDEATGAASLFATGFRSPDGMGFDAVGNFFINGRTKRSQISDQVLRYFRRAHAGCLPCVPH